MRKTIRDPAILTLAVVLSFVILFNIGTQLAKDRCLDAGGRVVEAGLDRICDFGAGATMPLNIMPATPQSWVLTAIMWVALVMGTTWGMSRFVRIRDAGSDSSDARGI